MTTKFKAVEFDLVLTETGRIEYYVAKDVTHAVQQVLYTKCLTDGQARVGPTGRVVYANGKSYSVVPVKEN